MINQEDQDMTGNTSAIMSDINIINKAVSSEVTTSPADDSFLHSEVNMSWFESGVPTEGISPSELREKETKINELQGMIVS